MDVGQPRPEEPAPKSGLPDFGTLKVSKSATADFEKPGLPDFGTFKVSKSAPADFDLRAARQDDVRGLHSDPVAAHHAALFVPGVPRDAEGLVFREPWEAQAFGMAVALHERGLFGWDEWAAMLGEEIKAAQRAGPPPYPAPRAGEGREGGATYYYHWLTALERMVVHKGVADRAALERGHDAWERAADRTPHGAPIELTAGDFVAK